MTGDEFRFDWDRAERTGTPEAVFCAGKTAGQIGAIGREALGRGQGLLFTRMSPEQARQSGLDLDYDPLSRTAFLGAAPESGPVEVAVICAGTSDLFVAREAVRTLHWLGLSASLHADIGVAGLWRLLGAIDEIRRHRVIIAVAGMEGALFCVLAGLVSAPVIAVPSSVGYGVGEGGKAALASALCSCAPGVMTVNIDNGFGAAVCAARIVAASGR